MKFKKHYHDGYWHVQEQCYLRFKTLKKHLFESDAEDHIRRLNESKACKRANSNYKFR